MAGIERYNTAPADVRRVAAELARLGAAVEVTMTRQTVRVDAAQRVAPVRPLPTRLEPVRHRPRVGRTVALAGTVVTGVAGPGFALGVAGVGLPALRTVAAVAGAAGVVLLVLALLLRKRCPGLHCGGCR